MQLIFEDIQFDITTVTPFSFSKLALASIFFSHISFFFLYSNVLKKNKNLSSILLRLTAGCMFVQVTHCFYGFEEFHSQSILFNSFKETSISPSILPSTLCRDTEGCSICQHTIFPAYIYYALRQVSTLTWSTIYLKTQSHLEPFHVAFHIISHLYSLRSSDVTHKNIFIKLFIYEPVLLISTVYFIQRYIYISMRLMRTFNKGGVAIGQTNGEPVTASHYNLL